jgi:hypothetical protein
MEHELYPWQRHIAELVTREDDRTVTMVLDTNGNNGKSIFSEYLEFKGLTYPSHYKNPLHHTRGLL